MYTENIQFSLEAMFHLIARSFIIQLLWGFQLNVQLTMMVWRGIITQNPTYGTFSYSGSHIYISILRTWQERSLTVQEVLHTDIVLLPSLEKDRTSSAAEGKRPLATNPTYSSPVF